MYTFLLFGLWATSLTVQAFALGDGHLGVHHISFFLTSKAKLFEELDYLSLFAKNLNEICSLASEELIC